MPVTVPQSPARRLVMQTIRNAGPAGLTRLQVVQITRLPSKTVAMFMRNLTSAGDTFAGMRTAETGRYHPYIAAEHYGAYCKAHGLPDPCIAPRAEPAADASTGLADTPQHGRHQGRPESGREQGRPDAAECGGAMADAERPCDRAQEPPAHCGRHPQAERPADQHGGLCGACVQPVAHTSSPRCQGRQLGRALHGHRGGRKHMDQLSNFVAHSSLPALQTLPGEPSCSTTPSTPRRLNPIFGEWLMGWPSQWTKAEPSASSASATALYRHRLQQHLSSLLDAPASLTEWKEAA